MQHTPHTLLRALPRHIPTQVSGKVGFLLTNHNGVVYKGRARPTSYLPCWQAVDAAAHAEECLRSLLSCGEVQHTCAMSTT